MNLSLEMVHPGMERKAYPSDVSDDEWAYAAPYLTLMIEEALQREHRLREVFNGLCWIVRAGAPWRMMPNTGSRDLLSRRGWLVGGAHRNAACGHPGWLRGDHPLPGGRAVGSGGALLHRCRLALSHARDAVQPQQRPLQRARRRESRRQRRRKACLAASAPSRGRMCR